MKIFSSLSLAALIFLASCSGPKQVSENYLQNVKDTSIRDVAAFTQPVIQKSDLLSIKVFSLANGLDPKPDAPYNLTEASASGVGGVASNFQVDFNGNIEFPQLGLLHAEGLTREQLADNIRKRLDTALRQPSVIVRFLNYRVTVLGEVRTPGTFTMPTERVTILDALGVAGDITEFGRRDNVKVIRETNGQIELATIDLTSRELFNSPYYRLLQNDKIVVEDNGKKLKQQTQQNTAAKIGIISSIITAAALILNFIK